MSGKKHKGLPLAMGSLKLLFNTQSNYQYEITGLHLPEDNIKWSSYHITALQEEIGELLKADKRWKTHRNTHYDPENKLEEWVDCFITLINIALYSGFDDEQAYLAILNKMDENIEKLKNARGGQEHGEGGNS